MTTNERITNIFTLNYNQLLTANVCTYVSAGIALMDNIHMLRRFIRQHTNDGCIRVDMNMIILCKKGKLQYLVNDEKVKGKVNSLMLVSTNSIMSDVKVSEDTECLVLFVPNQTMNHLLGGELAEWNRIVYFDRIYRFSLSNEDEANVDAYYKLILNQIRMTKPYRDVAIQSIIKVALYDLLGHYKQLSKKNAVVGKVDVTLHSNHLFQQFLELLSQTTPKRHSVNFYASQLSISSKYLTMICKRYSSKTAIEWVHEYVMAEIRHYFMQADASIGKVAELTGFDNLSFFSRFVKIQTGYTPFEYRKQLRCNNISVDEL